MRREFLKIAVVAALSAAASFGQFRGRANGGGTGTPPDPATVVAHRVAFLTSLLTLTTDQAAQATTIFTNELTAETPLRTSLGTAQTSLQAAVKSNSTATIDSLAQQIGTLQGQLTSAQSKANAAFYALLTADQKTKYDTLGGGRGAGFGPGGPGGHGPH
jgi:Spy/CpxP family protein refolding chaperone